MLPPKVGLRSAATSAARGGVNRYRVGVPVARTPRQEDMLQVPQSTDESGSIGAPRAQRRFRRVLLVLLATIVVLGALAGGLYWRATSGSIRLAFLTGRVEAALKERLPPDARVAVGSTAFSYRSGQGVVLRIDDLELVLSGMARVSVDELGTNTTVRALLSGRIDLSSVTASGVDIAVLTPPRVRGEGSGADVIRRASKAIMDQVLTADTLMRSAGLQEVNIREATIRLDDRSGEDGAPLSIVEANWVPLGDGRSKVWLQALEKNGSDWDVTLERRGFPDGTSSLTMEVEDFPSAALAPAVSAANSGAYFRSSLTLQARMAQKADGGFMGLRAVVSAGSGALSLNGIDEVKLKSAAINLVLDETGDRMTIPNGEIRTPAGRARFEGIADLAERGYITLVARVLGGTLPTPIGEAKPVQLIGGGGVARIDFASLGIEVEQFSLMTPEGSASIIGQASLAGETPGLSFALSITQMPAATVRALWPPFVAAKVRLWFDINVKGGMLGPATLQVALPPDHMGPRGRGKVLPPSALIGALPFQNAEFSPIRTFPTIKEAVGGITFGNASASIWAQTGVVEVLGKGDIQAGGTTLIISELGRMQPRGDLHLELAGTAAALAAVSNSPPLAVAAKRNIVPENLTGDAALSLDANIPIYESDFADVIPTFRLGLTGFTSTTPIDGRLISEADLVLEGNPKSYTVKGAGKLDGLDASIDVLLGSGAIDTSGVSVSLDDEARERLGIGLGSLLTGPVLASAATVDPTRQRIALDLKESRISLPFLGWEKGPGVPATASFVKEQMPDGSVEVTNFQLSGKGFEARGSISFGPDRRVRAMKLEKIALRAGDQLTAKVIADGSGYDVEVTGDMLDARGILEGVRSGGVGGGTADIFPIAIRMNVGVVRGQNDVALSNVTGTMTITKRGLDAASLKGKSNENQPFEWTLGREGDTRVLRLLADGGGALVRFSGIYSRIAGGSLILDYSGPVDGTGAGVAVMRDFRLLNETALQRAVSQTGGTRDGLANANSQASNDMQFSQLRIPFRQQGWVITIVDAALRGQAVGATASGTINIPGGKMAISGALIPVFGLLNVPNSIPLIGALFGGRNEGLFGITYRLYGPLDQPQFSMNPISALAPGIFRKIFERQ